jgi:hypothetical protein
LCHIISITEQTRKKEEIVRRVEINETWSEWWAKRASLNENYFHDNHHSFKEDGMLSNIVQKAAAHCTTWL